MATNTEPPPKAPDVTQAPTSTKDWRDLARWFQDISKYLLKNFQRKVDDPTLSTDIPALTANQFAWRKTSNTNIKLYLCGSDGVTRTFDLGPFA